MALARERGAAIRYDEKVQSPWFSYTDGEGQEREVWFEDARSLAAKLRLVREYGLAGCGVWNLDRPWPQGWTTLNALFTPEDPSW